MKHICFSFILFVCSCVSNNEELKHFHLECSGENISGINFKEGEKFLRNSSCRSKDFSRTGLYGFKLGEKQPYGPTYKFNHIKKGDVIYASIWRRKGKNVGKLVIASEIKFQYESSGYIVNEDGQWEQMKCSFVAKQAFEAVNVYIWNPENSTLYFDDLKIDCFRNNKKPDITSEKDILRINIPKNAMQNIVRLREKAIEQDIISDDIKSYFKASITLEGKAYPISIRIKGDWVDHLNSSDKWSYRIKIVGNETFLGMKKFSIQNPSTRSFMKEWFVHRLFEKENVLTTRYKFKVVYINGKNMGVYAVEEHFDKRLLEYRKRSEGPIVKFDESGFWQAQFHLKNTGEFKKYPYMQSAEILPFSKNKTLKDKVLLNQFIIAKSQMEKYRNRDTNIEEYIDIDKMAKFLAICDISKSTHGLAWHNQRNYFNPVKECLEPIGYDCYTNHPNLKQKLIIQKRDNELKLLNALFSSAKFTNIYLNYLRIFSDEKYLNSFILNIKSEIDHSELLLKSEYPMDKFDKNYFLASSKNVREELNEITSKNKSIEKFIVAIKTSVKWLDAVKKKAKENGVELEAEIKRNALFMVLNEEKNERINKNSYNKSIQESLNSSEKERVSFIGINQDVIFNKVSLNVYTVESKTNSSILQFENFLFTRAEVVGYSIKNSGFIPFKSSFFINSYLDEPSIIIKNFDFKPKEIYFKPSIENDSLIKIIVSKFPPSKKIK